MEIQEEKFSLNQVCAMLGEKAYNLKYLEKMLELNIERDMFSHKLYTKKNIEIIKKAKQLKTQKGLSYEEIKKTIQEDPINSPDNEILTIREKEIESINSNNLENGGAKEECIEHQQFVIDEAALEKIKSDITDAIIENIATSINKGFDDLKNSIMNDMEYLIKQNTDMKTNLELEIERYFNNIEIKIDGLKNSRSKKNRSLFKKIF